MEAVVRVALLQHSLAVHKRRVVVAIARLRFGAVTPDPCIQLQNLRWGPMPGLRVRSVVADRSEGAEDGRDVVRLGKLGNGLNVFLHNPGRFGTGVAGNVIGSTQKD